LFECIHNGELEFEDMVKIFELLGHMLNVKTVSEYARTNNISYQGALKRKLDVIEFGGLKLVTDNL